MLYERLSYMSWNGDAVTYRDKAMDLGEEGLLCHGVRCVIWRSTQLYEYGVKKDLKNPK